NWPTAIGYNRRMSNTTLQRRRWSRSCIAATLVAVAAFIIAARATEKLIAKESDKQRIQGTWSASHEKNTARDRRTTTLVSSLKAAPRTSQTGLLRTNRSHSCF